MASPSPASQITRKEFDALREQVEENRRTLEVQFKRIAQLQADLDEVRRTSPSTKPPRPSRK